MIKACIVQSVVAHYRRGVFDRIAAEPDIELTTIARTDSANRGVEPIRSSDTFHLIPTHERAFGPFLWRPGVAMAVRGDYDVVILPWHVKTIQLSWALRYGRRHGMPVVLWGHGFSKRESAFKTWQRNRMARLAAGLLLYDPVNAERMIELGYDRGRVFATRNAIDQTETESAIESWTKDSKRLEDFQREHRLVKSKTAVVIARLQPEKDLSVLIEAFAKVVAEEPAARLAVIGGGPCEQQLKSQVARLGLEEAVTFTGAMYDQNEIAPWCLSACCFPYPPDIGLGLQHGMAYGLPIITNDQLSVHGPEIHALIDGENGLLFRNNDADDLAAKVLRLMQDPELQDRMSKVAYATVRGPDGWSVEHMAGQFAKCIRALANSRGTCVA